MKNVVLLMSLLLSFLMVGCSQDVGLTVNISWDDNDDFTETGDWYLAVTVGSYIVDQAIAENAFDQETVEAGENSTVTFSYSGDSDMYTAFVYLDANGNGSFDSDTEYITGYTTEWIDAGEEMTFEVTPYY